MASTGTERNLTESEFKEQLLNEATSVTPNYSVDYTDDRFSQVDTDIKQQESDYNKIYGGMINNSDQFYNDQIQASKDWADKQSQIQQENTDFAIEQIEQQKDQANKDYIREQSGAYVDWQKQSNQYGAEAEKMASAGLINTGFSESSQVGMYNTYQNRVATARDSYQRAVLNYDNAIKDAQLQNNAALAEIAYNALQQQLELSLQGFQYKNQLILDLTDKKAELNNTKWNRYQDILNQINTENALAEDVRQFNENMAFQERESALDREFQASQAEIERKFKSQEAQLDRDFQMKLQEAKTKAEKEMLAQQHKNDLEKLKKQQEYELAQLDKKLANDKALIKYQQSFKSGGSGGSSSGSKIKSNNNNSGNNTVKITATNSGSNGKFSTSNVLELGYGPISGTQVSKLVNSGEVNVTKDKNNNVTFSKTAKSVSLPTWDLMKKANKVK